MTALLTASRLHHAYRQKTVLSDVSLTISAGEFVAIIGPNGSGKSTLLRSLGRLLRPNAGTVTLAGEPVFVIDPKAFARRVAFVPQGPTAPPDLVVEELVWRGRFPHRGLFGRRLGHDRAMVDRAMALADIAHLRGHAIGTLSGGERQRAFIALALAQEPLLLLLDEPTTFLDIAHQLDLLALLARLNRDEGLTVVAVMHDLGQAALFARRLIAIREGRVVADGDPREVVTEPGVRAIFGAGLRVTPDPVTGLPLVLPAALPPAVPTSVDAPQPPPAAAPILTQPVAPAEAKIALGRPAPRIGPRRRKPRSVGPAAVPQSSPAVATQPVASAASKPVDLGRPKPRIGPRRPKPRGVVPAAAPVELVEPTPLEPRPPKPRIGPRRPKPRSVVPPAGRQPPAKAALATISAPEEPGEAPPPKPRRARATKAAAPSPPAKTSAPSNVTGSDTPASPSKSRPRRRPPAT